MRFRPFLILAAGLAACEPTLENAPAPSPGSVDFSRYVAVGDDYMAGAANSGLTRASQEYSVANLLAGQFRLVGGGGFTQPLLAEGESTQTLQLLSVTDAHLPLLGPGPISLQDSVRTNAGSPCAEVRYQYPRWSGAGTLPQNLAVPGLRLGTLGTAGLGNEINQDQAGNPYNAYLERLVGAGENRSYRELAQATQPTFFTVSVGLNDLMPYLRSGGTCTPLPNGRTISAQLRPLLDSLLKAGGKGIILKVPELAALPLLQTTVIALNQRLGLPDTTSLYFTSGAGTQKMQPTDVVLLPMVARVGRNETADGQPATAPFGSMANPLRDQDVLTKTEINSANNLIRGIDGINAEIDKRVTAAGGRLLAYDLNTLFLELSGQGVQVNGVQYGTDLLTGGTFSYDGYTLSPRGNALLVNAILGRINQPLSSDLSKTGFGAHIPYLDVNQFPPTPLP